MSCVICQEARNETPNVDVVDHITFYLSGQQKQFHVDIVSCSTCGYTWVNPPIPPEALTLYYESQSRWPSETVAYKEQVAFIEKFFKIPGTIAVDVGSFDGRLLHLLLDKDAGSVFGVEPDLSIQPSYTRFDTIGEACYELSDAQVGLVTMGHVFEHLQDPIAYLEKVKQLLMPGGTLMIEVPNLEDPQIQIVPYWTPFHHSYFTPLTLAYMLEVAGFTMIAQELTGYRSIRVIARAFKDKVENWGQAPPPHPTRTGVLKYKNERFDLLNDLREKMSWLHSDTLAIFGTGDHTYWLIHEFPDLLKNTAVFLDSDTDRQGKHLYGRPVMSPAFCPDDVDTVIISSYDSQDEMATVIGKRSFQLYEDVRAYDVWLGTDEVSL
ncbi:MAG: class I SAM-dependent methyltransferase [Candidatus Thorarchaeota archaeon]|jgi:SAM-dependent methyltransferase